jgi:putative heme-binding domain-containing protein
MRSISNLQVAWLLWIFLIGGRSAIGQQEQDSETNKPSPPASVASGSRLPWTTSRVIGTPDPLPPYRHERLFPKISFQNPVVITIAPGMDRWFVGEQSGKIFSFRDDPNTDRKDLFFDASELLKTEPPDSPAQALDALYGLTFHPRFAENRFCYVCYVVRGKDASKQLEDGTRVSRFTVTQTDPPQIDLASEQRIITWLQGGHNGGCLKFGPDGYLYISTGDGGPAFPPDPLNAGQDITNLLSAVLRIDVDRVEQPTKKNYSIPSDNPFVNIAGARAEIWCYGLRNPWKMSFDRGTGDLWIGDVGWELWEMVYRAERGGNYGWSIVEGPQSVHVDRQVGPTPILAPALSIAHSDGVSITGGFVYRGKRFPELVGQYIFGDWETRRIWSAKWDGRQLVERRDLVEPSVRIIDFAEDAAGEMVLLDYDDGTLHGFATQIAADQNQAFPKKLSETGLFADVAKHTLAPGVVPFSVNTPQWSDHALAERFVAVPGSGTIKIHARKQAIPGSMFQAATIFPINSVLVKTLSLDFEHGNPATRHRVETQMLHFDGKFWRCYSYRWNEAQSDALLVEAEGNSQELAIADPSSPGGIRPQTWRFSSRTECARCHNQWAEYTLAFNPRQLGQQLSAEGGTRDQLVSLQQLGVVTLDSELDPSTSAGKKRNASKPMSGDPFVDPYRQDGNLSDRVRSYLHVNCAHCHRNGGGGTAYIELQQELSLDKMKILGVKPTQGTFGIDQAEIINPGDPYRSVLLYRMSKIGSGRMPHLGSELVDQSAIQMLHDWIAGLPRPNGESLAGKDEQELVDQLFDPENKDSKREVMDQLLSTTSRALRLQHAIDQHPQATAVRDAVASVASSHQDAQVRDLFERYLPAAKRVRRLGPTPDINALLKMTGDASRGRELFFNAAGIQCKTCHQVGGRGGKAGPELSQIGKKYSKAQLLESLLSPSKTIDPKFQTQVITTADGRVLTGVVVERTEREWVLRDAKDQEMRLPSEDVEVSKVTGQSLMPDQLLRDLTAEQAADLLAFLESLR